MNRKTMKNIYLISGIMGVGKTATCQVLKNKLPNGSYSLNSTN